MRQVSKWREVTIISDGETNGYLNKEEGKTQDTRKDTEHHIQPSNQRPEQ